MTWDELLAPRADGATLYDDCRAMAKTWTKKVRDPDSVDDLTNDLAIYLIENVDLSRAHGDPRSYVAGCLWRGAHKLLLSSWGRRQWREHETLAAIDPKPGHLDMPDLVAEHVATEPARRIDPATVRARPPEVDPDRRRRGPRRGAAPNPSDLG